MACFGEFFVFSVNHQKSCRCKLVTINVAYSFREDLARIYAAEIVSAVSHLHSNGVMHRDLKPENILLDVEGHVLFCSPFSQAHTFTRGGNFDPFTYDWVDLGFVFIVTGVTC